MGDLGECRLLGGPAAISAQLLLATLAMGSLLYKRHLERPQRPLNIWGLDVSKQAVSMLAAHACGMLIALIAHSSIASAASTSECSWYFVAFTFDTTIGLALTIGLHKAALLGAHWLGQRSGQRHGSSGSLEPAAGGPTDPAHERWFEAMQLCGNYGEPPSLRRWGIQLGEWVACVIAARALCGTLVVLLGGLLVHVAQGLDSLFSGHPILLLYFVMICCPLIMNICQVLVQDLVLKWRRGGAGDSGTGLAKLDGAAGAGLAAEREASLLGPGSERSAPA